MFADSFLDKKLIQFVTIAYLLAYLVDFFSALLLQAYGISSDRSLSALLGLYLLGFVIKFVYIIGAIWMASQLIYRNVKPTWSLLIHLLAAIMLSFYTAFFTLLVNRSFFGGEIQVSMESVIIRGLNGLSFNFFIYLSILGIVYAYYFLHRNRKVELERERLKGMMLDAKINALQSQLQPHFLFNAMNDISSLMRLNVERAQDAIADLSLLLRKTLQIKDYKTITLSKELDLLSSYMNIEILRYGDKLQYTQEISLDTSAVLVPPLMLQPFVENCIKHGFGLGYEYLRIEVLVRKRESVIQFEIRNNGVPIQSESDLIFGNGISNVLSRLETLYPNRYAFSLENVHGRKDDNWVAVIIDIPYQPSL